MSSVVSLTMLIEVFVTLFVIMDPIGTPLLAGRPPPPPLPSGRILTPKPCRVVAS